MQRIKPGAARSASAKRQLLCYVALKKGSHQLLDHFGRVLVVGGVLLASVDAHLQHLGLHVVAHVRLEEKSSSIKHAEAGKLSKFHHKC